MWEEGREGDGGMEAKGEAGAMCRIFMLRVSYSPAAPHSDWKSGGKSICLTQLIHQSCPGDRGGKGEGEEEEKGDWVEGKKKRLLALHALRTFWSNTPMGVWHGYLFPNWAWLQL